MTAQRKKGLPSPFVHMHRRPPLTLIIISYYVHQKEPAHLCAAKGWDKRRGGHLWHLQLGAPRELPILIPIMTNAPPPLSLVQSCIPSIGWPPWVEGGGGRLVTIAHTKRAVTQYGDRAGGEGGQKNMGGWITSKKKSAGGKNSPTLARRNKMHYV